MIIKLFFICKKVKGDITISRVVESYFTRTLGVAFHLAIVWLHKLICGHGLIITPKIENQICV